MNYSDGTCEEQVVTIPKKINSGRLTFNRIDHRTINFPAALPRFDVF